MIRKQITIDAAKLVNLVKGISNVEAGEIINLNLQEKLLDFWKENQKCILANVHTIISCIGSEFVFFFEFKVFNET